MILTDMSNQHDLAGKVVIVTGSGQGMGRAVAERFAEAGARLMINDIDAAAAQRAASDLARRGIEAACVAGDVTVGAEVARICQIALDRYGTIDILVNNAGILRPTAVIDIEEDEWDLVIGVNLKGTYLCSRAVLPAMRRAGWGRIINFSSTAGKNVSTVGGAHYTAAKAGILGFTRHLAREVAADGITVNAVCPGLIDTQMVRRTIDEAQVRAFAASFPIPRLGRPQEVAELVAFLASDRAGYITGASLDINGGDLMI